MSQLTQEEARDETLSLFEEHEETLVLSASNIEKIEDDAMTHFEMQVIAIKNKLINDITVPEDELEKRCLAEVELLRKSIMENVAGSLKELIKKQEETV